jgi:chemosensory pili system protein ChpA (sensor histidine kinase/response regulator)
MPEIASQTLELVGREVTATLTEARSALENYVEQPDNVALVERCAQDLHQVQGVLRVLEIYGAALLAEEMEQVAHYLIATVHERKGQAESLDALMRAMVQLPSYLERVLAGGRDLALVLLPLLNDLRAVRGHALLSEGTLLLLNLKSDKQAQPQAASAGEPPMTVEQWARRLRARYQQGLIGWIRGERPEQNLEILAAVAHKLEQIATRQPVFQLWWVIGAVIESLQHNGLDNGQSVKRLLGLGDREMRRLYEEGEARYAQSPPIELLNNLLYYVGRAESSGGRVSAVRASFRLAELLPVDESIEQERENLSAPSVKLMQTVAAAIREDLGRVKDVLDIFVRRGAGQPAELIPQVELLRKIGDTLGVLGLGELRGSVQQETQRLEQIVSGALPADESTLVGIAATLISVEDRLDDRLVGLILPRDTAAEPEGGTDTEFQQVQAAVLRECIVNLARIKEAITQSVGGTLDAAGLDSWQDLMRGMKAGLLMLGKGRAVEVIEGITRQLKRVMQPGIHVLPQGFVDRLADAIVSVEYYMETLQAGRSDPWYMLDNAQACVQALAEQPTPSVPTVEPLEPSAYARTVAIPTAAPLRTPPDAAGVGATAPTLSPSATGKIAALAESADPELVRLFTEEAREELEKIQHSFPAWEQNPLEHNALVTVRRSFHTLKGSGRMVGARELGEFAWAIENLLNRVLDNTLTRSPAILETLRAAVAALPEMVAQLDSGPAPKSDVAAICARAHALAAGRSAAPLAPASSAEEEEEPGESATAVFVEIPPPATTAPPAPAAAARPAPPQSPRPATAAASRPVPSALMDVLEGVPPSADTTHFSVPALPALASAPADDAGTGSAPALADDTLRDIYARETATHIATVRAFISREASLPEPHLLTEEVYRACHTLSGSSKMAQARHGIRLAEPLDHWLRRAFSSGAGIRNEDLVLLGECMAAMHAVATHLDEPTGYFLSHWQLLERIDKADRWLDQRIAATTAHDAPPEAAAPAAEAATPEGEPQDEPPDFDPEVAAIFTDEATELIDASEHALAEWRAHPGSAELRLGLKRPLHTLKGGARMAGILPMGDLAHELESLVMQVDNGKVSADAAVFDLIQASLDELARMREHVAAGQRVAPARAMLARIQVISRPAAAAPGATPAGPAAPAPPATAPKPSVAAPAPATTPPKPSTAAAAPAVAPPAPQTAPAPVVAAPRPAVTPPAPSPPPPAAAPPARPTVTPPPTPAPPPRPAVSAPPAQPPAPAPAIARPAQPVTPAVARAGAAAPAAGRPVSGSAAIPVSDTGILKMNEELAHAAEESPVVPQPVPPGREPAPVGERQEMARVDAELLDQLLNVSGEASIARARLEQQLGSLDFNLGELSRTVTRLKEQLRSLEIETEAQILHKHDDEGPHRSQFDPLELDRYSSIQQYSRALAETANDVASIQQLLENLAKDTQGLLQQQARTITELQNGLMRTRMVPFQRHVQRLARIVRQAAADTGKRAELTVEGASGELDRQVLERMLPPFEHMLRNAVVHGIEKPEERARRGKPETGHIVLALQREGAEVMVRLADDGGGMNLKAIRDKGEALGLIAPGQALSDEDAMQLILEPGFSTAGSITQQAGRGVGMDVVATEIKRLGGALHMETRSGEGSVFTVRLPLTLAISHALVVRADEEYYALPLPTVEGVLRLSKAEVSAHLGRDATFFEYGGVKYRFQHLASFVGLEPAPLPVQDVTVPVVLVRAGEHSTGLVADELVGSREIVVKSVGPQISSIRGISGATILGDGRIVIILDIGALVRAEWRARIQPPAPVPKERGDRRIFAMVVDDSITVRRVTQRLLERNGMRVITARDGMDAVALLQDNVPDVILLDIEMPRMDGYEVAAHVRNDPRLRDVPIIMVTSRVGEKHRARAIELGVDDYLGKPYQEAQLLDAIAPLVERRRAAVRQAASAS